MNVKKEPSISQTAKYNRTWPKKETGMLDTKTPSGNYSNDHHGVTGIHRTPQTLVGNG